MTGAAHGAVVLNPDGSFTYTPASNYFGEDSFAYRATNGVTDSNAVTVSIAIAPVNDAPVATDGFLTTDQGIAATGTLLATDVDGTPVTFSLVQAGALGLATLVDAATGEFRYQPNPGATGTDVVTFTASDGQLVSDTGSIAITIKTATLTIVSPNGGESLSRSARQTIRWQFTGQPPPKVRLELLIDEAVHAVIAANVAVGTDGAGAYVWTIGKKVAPGVNYRIRIVSTKAAGIADVSDAPFRVGF